MITDSPVYSWLHYILSTSKVTKQEGSSYPSSSFIFLSPLFLSYSIKKILRKNERVNPKMNKAKRKLGRRLRLVIIFFSLHHPNFSSPLSPRVILHIRKTKSVERRREGKTGDIPWGKKTNKQTSTLFCCLVKRVATLLQLTHCCATDEFHDHYRLPPAMKLLLVSSFPNEN